MLVVNYSKKNEIGELLATLVSFRDDINNTEPQRVLEVKELALAR